MNFESPKWRRADETVIIDDATAARRRRRNIIIALVAVAAVLIIAFLMFGRGESDTKVAVKAGESAEAAPAVSVVVPGRQQVARTISATGQLAARYDMPV